MVTLGLTETETLGLTVTVGVTVTVVRFGLGVVSAGEGVVSAGLESGALALEVAAPKLDATLEIALETVPLHPAARHRAARMTADRRRLLGSRRMPVPSMPRLPRPLGQVIAVNDSAGEMPLPHPHRGTCWTCCHSHPGQVSHYGLRSSTMDP